MKTFAHKLIFGIRLKKTEPVVTKKVIKMAIRKHFTEYVFTEYNCFIRIKQL